MAVVVGAGIAAVGAVGSASMSSSAAKDAASTQANAANAQSAQQIAMQKPWMDAGTQALGQLTTGLAPGGQFTKQFSMADAVNSPAEQHSLEQGTQAIQNSAAAKGGLINSNTMQDLTTFGQANAAQYENQAFNQWLASKNSELAPLQSLAGLGQTSTAQVADNTANLGLAGANATAAGIIGSNNAQVAGINNAGNQISMLAGLFGKNVGGGGASTPGGSTSYGMPEAYNTDTGATYTPASTYGP